MEEEIPTEDGDDALTLEGNVQQTLSMPPQKGPGVPPWTRHWMSGKQLGQVPPPPPEEALGTEELCEAPEEAHVHSRTSSCFPRSVQQPLTQAISAYSKHCCNCGSYVHAVTPQSKCVWQTFAGAQEDA